MFSPLLSSKALWKPSGVAAPDLRCCGPDEEDGKE